MKTFNITNRVSVQARAEMQRIVDTHERYKKSYFFKPSRSATGRRMNEDNFNKNNRDVAFMQADNTIEVSMSYSESCQNVYYSLSVKVNGQAKNIRVIKNILERNN